jgi:hypothetical protein
MLRRSLFGFLLGAPLMTFPQNQPGFKNPGLVEANIVIIEGAKGSLLVYQGAPASGNLIASIAGLQSTDKYGNAYLSGIVSYQTGGPGLFATQHSVAGVAWWTATTQAGPWTQTGTQLFAVIANGSFPYATVIEGQTVISPNGAPPVTSALLEVQGTIAGVNGSDSWTRAAAADGHAIENREVELTNIGASPATPGTGVKVFALGGRFYVIDEDGNVYALGDQRLFGTGNPQLVNSTGFTTVAGLSTSLGVGKYEVDGFVVLEGVAAAAGNPEFQFNGTAVMTSMHVTAEFHPETGANIVTNGANATALASTMTGQTLSVTGTQVLDFHGTLIVATAGTFHLDAACSVAADTYDIFGTVSYMNIKPT